MTFEPPRKGGTGLAAVLASLDQRLENEHDVLEAYLLALIRGQLTPEAWTKLFDAARRDDRMAELAFAFEELAQDRRLKTLQPASVAELMFRAAIFFGDYFGDEDGLLGYLERAIAASPLHAGATDKLETVLAASGNAKRRADFYASTAAHRPREQQAGWYRKAAELYEEAAAVERAIDTYQAVIKLEPNDGASRSRLVALLEAQGKTKELVKVLEGALTTDPPPDPSHASGVRTHLLALYERTGEPEKALAHAEALLETEPENANALSTVMALIENKATAARAASILAKMSERAGNHAEVAHYLAIELEHTRGSRRVGVLRKLAVLRQDVLGDLPGAYESLEAAIGLDPSDDDIRQRWQRVVRALGKHAEAVRTLQRLSSITRDPPLRARLTVEMGEMLLATGDTKRARAVLASALSAPGIDNPGIVQAALGLAGLYEAEGDHASLADMLERVAMLDTIEQRRWAACERLAELASGPLQEPTRAIIAWKGLLGSPLRQKALSSLEKLLADVGDAAGLAEILIERARDMTDREAARETMLRAADALCDSNHTERASHLLREAFDRFGPSRDLVARWKPLLEAAGDWSTLETIIEHDVKLAPHEEKAALLAQLGMHRLQRTRDLAGAVREFGAALAIDPCEPTSRTALEQLMASEDDAIVIAAADVLEPIYRAESSRGALVRVLATRATRAPSPAERLSSIREAVALALPVQTEHPRALELVRRAMTEALAIGEPVLPWLDQLRKLLPDDAERRGDILYRVLSSDPAEPKGLLLVARAAGDALVQADDVERALVAYRKALELSPGSPDLVEIVDDLLQRSGTPQDRLALYAATLERETDRNARIRLLHQIADLQRGPLGDPGGAMRTLERLLTEEPNDGQAADDLAALYVEHEMWRQAASVLEARLAASTSHKAIHARLAELYARAGDADAAIRHCRALLDDDPSSADLDLVESVATSLSNTTLVTAVIERRVSSATEPAEKIFWLERLGHTQSEPRTAAATLKEAARLADSIGDIERSRGLWERVRKLAPFDPETTRRLVAILEERDEHEKLPPLYAELAECAPDASERYDALSRMARVLADRIGDAEGAVDAAARAFATRPADPDALAELERYATRFGHYTAFVRAIDGAAARTLSGEADEPRTLARWARARARGLAGASETRDDAMRAFRDLMEDGAVPIEERLGAADDYQSSLEKWGDASELEWVAAWRERHWSSAVDSLRERIAAASGDGKRKLRIELASLLVSRADHVNEGLEELDRLLEEADSDEERARVLSTLLEQATSAPKEDRIAWHRQALALSANRPPAERYTRVLRALAEAPDQEDWWSDAEALAREIDDPKPLAATFDAVLASGPSPEIASLVGERAVALQEEWFDDTRGVERILDRLLAIDPSSSWAFDRLKLLYDAAERWDDLFALYDRAIGSASGARKIELLEDAAQVAKDFAGHSERAIAYLEQLLAEKPGNARIVASLERLYERHARHRALVELLAQRLPSLPESEAQALRARIAGIWLDEIQDAGSALLVVEDMLAHEEGSHGETIDGLLQRILTSAAPTEEVRKTLPPPAEGDSLPPRASVPPPRASVPPPAGRGRGKRVLVRQRAAAILRERYGASGRERDLVRVLEIELETVKNAKERIRRHREIADLYAKLGDDAAALEHSVSLVLLEPDVREHRERLAHLADRVGRADRYADALTTAADDCADDALRVELIMQAAAVQAEKLGDGARAIDLYFRGLSLEAPPEMALAASRKLDALLEAAGRTVERLGVLERMAHLETDADGRRTTLGTLARLATSVGETERALAAWAARLERDAADLEALDGTIALLESTHRFEELVKVLAQRARAVSTVLDAQAASVQAKSDRVRIARILSKELSDPAAAITAWQEIERDFGESDEGTFALASLFAETERWTDLADLLSRAAERANAADRKAALLRRLGDIAREHLDAPEKAAASYEAALAVDPTDEGSLAGLAAMLGQHDGAPRAPGNERPRSASQQEAALRLAPKVLAILIDAYRRTDSWQRILELTDHRLKFAQDDAERVTVLREVARIAEERANDPALAFEAMRKAFVAGRGDDGIAEELMRLATATGSWRAFADAHRQAIDAAENGTWRDAELLARLRMRLGRVLETQLDDARGALAAYARVAADTPSDVEACVAAIRVSGRVARWDIAVKVVVDHSIASGTIEDQLISALEDVATAPAAWDAVTGAFAAAVAERTELPHELARGLEARLAVWHLDRRGDPDAAEAAYMRALAHDPQNTDILRRLADLQRRAKGRPLIDSLLRLSQATGGDLDLLREAAEVATSVVADRGLAKTIVERLFRLGIERWTPASAHSMDAPSTGTPQSPGPYVDWALGELIRIHNEEGNAERIVELLVEASHLPFEIERARSMRHEAARVATDRLGDVEGALVLYLELFEEDPHDREAAARLAQLYAQTGRNAQLLALRRRQIEIAEPEERMQLRLEVARLERVLGRPDAAIEELRTNLGESPRDAATASALAEVLEQLERWPELVAFYTEQAELAEQAGDTRAAADLWSLAADLSERKLADIEGAIVNHRRVVKIELRASSLDALARLLEARGDHEGAADYLDRLATITTDDQSTVIARLADALVASGRSDLARVRLEGSLQSDPSASALSDRLARIYRKTHDWGPLADLLTRSARYADPKDKLLRLREAAELQVGPCNAPDRAVPLLEEACSLAPDDRRLKLALADALGAAGRADDARTLLKQLVDGFGQRKPKERAQVHFHLARLDLATGQRKQALAELDAAMRIDAANPQILRMVAELARDDGQLDKAERAYRALLTAVRKTEDAGDDAPVLRTEVLVELSEIASRQGDESRAEEILESAFEIAASSEPEACRLERALLAKKKHTALVRAIEARISRLEGQARGEALAELGTILDRDLGRVNDAADALLRAVALAPSSSIVHDAAIQVTSRASREADYAKALETAAESARAANELRLYGQLLLRRARIAESAGDAKGAASILEGARRAGAPAATLDVLRTLDRLYGEIGDAASQEAVLGELVLLEVETTSRDPRTAAEALYRLAELRALGERAPEAAQLLAVAIDLAPDLSRASRIAAEASLRAPNDPGLLELHERLARAAGNGPALAHALLRRAEVAPDPLPLLEEAVRAAEEDIELLEEALRRCEAKARGRNDALALDSLHRLADLRERRGDRREALRITLEAADLEAPEAARATRMRVADAARRELRDLDLAQSAYEHMLEVDAQDEVAALGLVEALAEAGKTDALPNAIARALDVVSDPGRRAALRLERAKLLTGPLGRSEEAVEDLREAFEASPDRDDIAQMLGDLLSRLGRGEELEQLVMRQLDAAKDRGDAPRVAALAMRLASLAHDRPERAREMLVMGLDWEPQHTGLLRALLALLDRQNDATERMGVLDRLLALTQGEEAEPLALELAGLLAESWDSEGAERALERGLAAHPGSRALRERLFQLYADRGDAPKLAALHEQSAEGTSDAQERVARLREAARLYAELGSPTDSARVLGRLRALVPDDPEVLDALVDASSASGDLDGAVRELGAALERASGPRRASLLARRARLRLALGDVEGALADAKEAHAGDVSAADLLIEVLERAAAAAAPETRRAHLLEIARVLHSSGRPDDARERLARLKDESPHDRGILRALARLDMDAERWSEAALVLSNLATVEEPERLIETALMLSECSERAHLPELSRAGLERAHAEFPEDGRITQALAALYANLGATDELVSLELDLARRASDPTERAQRLTRLGATLLTRGDDPKRAQTILGEAYELRPGDVECGTLLAEALRRLGRESDAVALLQGLIASHRGRRSRDLATVYQKLAVIERERGDHASELAALSSALEMDAQNGVVASELSDVALRLGQLDVAQKALRAVTMLKTPAPLSRAVAYQLLGEIAHTQGDIKRAVMLLKRAVDEDGSLDRARKLLSELQSR
jgi:predicted Zn-dependent protease